MTFSIIICGPATASLISTGAVQLQRFFRRGRPAARMDLACHHRTLSLIVFFALPPGGAAVQET
jgi:hypothetical protein